MIKTQPGCKTKYNLIYFILRRNHREKCIRSCDHEWMLLWFADCTKCHHKMTQYSKFTKSKLLHTKRSHSWQREVCPRSTQAQRVHVSKHHTRSLSHAPSLRLHSDLSVLLHLRVRRHLQDATLAGLGTTLDEHVTLVSPANKH